MGRLKVHTVNQPDSEITTFILSCNRLHLLDQTIQSYLRTAGMPTKVVLLDDSGAEGVFEKLVAAYGHFADIICFPENRGLWWAKDFMVSYCYTPYIFYLEDDWLLLQSGYLQASKEVLEKHREIGSVDISWRTFEEEGIDSYEPQLIDNAFYYKKPWQITSNHLHWFIWQNSPNLRRRTDLILLGRIEEYYTEWNIDRKFTALGFRGCFLAGRYVRHIGDHESLMVNKRPREHATPETLFPAELKKNRIFPEFDYYWMDSYARQWRGNGPTHRSPEKVLVTALIDIGRENIDGRSFEQHYMRSLQQLLQQKIPLLIFCEPRYYDQICAMSGGQSAVVYTRSVTDLHSMPCYQRLSEIVGTSAWQNQAAWMQHSIIRKPEYLALTLYKLDLLLDAVQNRLFHGQNFYWVDAGICSSYHIENLQQFNLNQLPTDKLFLTSYPYVVENEIHGFNRQGYSQLCGQVPDRVARATIFGGNETSIRNLHAAFQDFLQKSLTAGYVGTEESILTGLLLQQPQLFNEFKMPNGNIQNYLQQLQR